MAVIFNRPSTLDLRRKLRKQSTPAERVLWQYISNKQISDCRFRRQFGVGKFILDFYSPAIRLAIELDGLSHEGGVAQANDETRVQYLEQLGIQVVRFTNHEVATNLEGVVTQVGLTVKRLLGQDPS